MFRHEDEWPPHPERLQPMEDDRDGTGFIRWAFAALILMVLAAALIAAQALDAANLATPAPADTPVAP